ncbi:MAG: glycosyltransferase family 87 protein [Acidimicrobiales bacterium]
MISAARRPSHAIAARVAAVAVLLTGLGAIILMSWLVNHQYSFMFTLHTKFQFKDILGRVSNLANLRHTGNIYVPFGYQAFTYPPGAILFFWPLLWIPAEHVTLLWTLASVLALAGAFFVSLVYLTSMSRVMLAGLSCWVAVVAAAAFPEVAEGLMWGQTATILLVMVLVDVLLLQGPAKGVLVGLATAVKIYPGLFIVVWLLRRQWRAAFTALATTVVVTGTACLLWPTSGRTFFQGEVFGGLEFDKLASSQYVNKSNSVTAFFQRSPFHYGLLSPHLATVISAAAMALSLFAAHRLWRRHLELSAAMVVLIGGAIGSPVAWDHYFSFLPLLGLVVLEVRWNSALAWIALFATAVALVPWVIFRSPTTTSTWTTTYAFIARNALLFASLAVVLAALGGGRARGERHVGSDGPSPSRLTPTG